MTTVFDYFQDQAKTGIWGSLYDRRNPSSYPFRLRITKSLDLLGNVAGKTVLDLGCGTGILLPHIVNNGGSYIGVDISDNMLTELKTTYRIADDANTSTSNVKIVLGDIGDISLHRNVDIAIGLGFLEYFDNPGAVMDKLYASIKAGGDLILSFPNSNSFDHLAVKLFAPVRFVARKLTGKKTVQPPRIHWNAKYAKALFEQHGFKNVRVVNYHINFLVYPFTRLFPRLTNFASRISENTPLSKINFLATSFIVIGEK